MPSPLTKRVTAATAMIGKQLQQGQVPQVDWAASRGEIPQKEIEQLAEVLEAASFELENKGNEIAHLRALSSDNERRCGEGWGGWVMVALEVTGASRGVGGRKRRALTEEQVMS